MNTSKEYVKSANPIQVYNKGNIINESKKGWIKKKEKKKRFKQKGKRKMRILTIGLCSFFAREF